MKALAPSISLPLLVNAALVFQLRACVVAAAAARATTDPSASASYRSTGAEERWLAEEEFHGASSSESKRLRRRRKKTANPRPAASSFPEDDVGERSWWDDDDDESDDETPNQLSASPSTSIKSDKTTARPKRHRLRIWKNGKKGGRGERTGTAGATKSASSGGESPVAEPSPTITAAEGDSVPGSGLPPSDYDEEHPMRTDEWRLDVRLSRLLPREEGGLFPECHRATTDDRSSRGGDRYRKRQVMQFARNGYVKVLEEGKRRGKPKVGRWRIGHSGVAFDIPMQVACARKKTDGGDDDGGPNNNSRTTTVLHYHADMHLNKFGERPRMFRGVITRDRHSSFLPPNFLRPVVGTFSAEGIGRDTADTSYRERAISLSRQQVINDARKENSQ